MKQNVQVWFSSEEGTPMPDGSLNAAGARYRLSLQPDIAFTEPYRAKLPSISVDPTITYQSILGIGSSLEEATIYNLRRMPDGDKVLRSFVDPVEGIGWNLMRICFGSSDFTARPYYSYDDMPSGEIDVNLEQFSINKDIEYGIIDTVKKAMSYNPALKIFASPWSPPAWMKSGGTMCGGSLLPQYSQVAARYYCMAVQAYEAQGIPIHALTLQNEPLMVHKCYPTTRMTWQEQRDFLKLVKTEFMVHDLNTQIWIFDHNFNEAMTYPGRILQDPEAYSATDGVAFHAYEGKVEQMSQLHQAFPEKDIFFTEYSTWRTGGIEKVLSYFRNWSRSYTAWVNCLDDQRQPNAGPHHASPTFVTVSSTDPSQYWYIPEYYLLGQVAKFVQSGALRIKSDAGSPKWVTDAAFLNPDGTVVLVVVNQGTNAQLFRVLTQSAQFVAEIPAKTVGTWRWQI